jgi:hypothetical protein
LEIMALLHFEWVSGKEVLSTKLRVCDARSAIPVGTWY